MKRKQTESNQSSSDTKRRQKFVEAPNETDLKLKSVCTITSPSELTSHFCLLSADDHIVLRTKMGFEIMTLENSSRNDHTKFQMTSSKFPCSTYEPGLKVNQKRLYNSSSHEQKQDIMLSQALFPDCVLIKIQVKKTQLAPFSPKLPDIVASLTTRGSLELSKYKLDIESQENTLEKIGEICEIRKKSFELSSSYTNFEKLQEILKELTFNCFDWCPQNIDTNRHIVAVSKSNELLLYSVGEDSEIKVVHCERLDNVITEVKWCVTGQSHFLFLGTSKGVLIRFSIEVEGGALVKLTKSDEVQGKLKIPIACIEVVQGTTPIVICTKSNSVEIFSLYPNGSESSTQYVGCSITGITRVHPDHPEFLIATLNNKIFYMRLSSTGKVEEFERVDNTSSQELNQTHFGAYGITASKNKALIFVAVYPQQSFDHLVVKQPACIIVNAFSKTDPCQILIENKSMKLTEFADCVEAVRYMGSASLDALEPLETLQFETKLDGKFLYYLKLQLIVRRAKMAHYQPRSEYALKAVTKEETFIKTLIEVVNALFLLKSLMTNKKPSIEIQMVMRCLANYLKVFLDSNSVHDLFKAAQQSFKATITSLVEKCKIPATLKPESCHHCDNAIEKDKLTCELNHQSIRCVILKLQLPVSSNNVCVNCNCCVIDMDILKRVNRGEQLCPFCDRMLM